MPMPGVNGVRHRLPVACGALILILAGSSGIIRTFVTSSTLAAVNAFDDEFSNTSLDTTAWVAMNRPGDQSNAEQQCYKPGNVSVDGANLVILTKQDSSCAGYSYTSAMVQWKSFNFTYGYVEVRAKLAGGQGPWPAIWLLGANCQQTNVTNPGNIPPCSWPNPGSDEIDMTEILSSNHSMVNQGIHAGSGAPGCYVNTSDVSQNFHVYGLNWSAGKVVWTIDGTTTCTITSSVPSNPMFLLLNTALGGSGGGINSATLPQSSFIDYVRVNTAGPTPTPGPSPSPSPSQSSSPSPAPSPQPSPSPSRSPSPTPAPNACTLTVTGTTQSGTCVLNPNGTVMFTPYTPIPSPSTSPSPSPSPLPPPSPSPAVSPSPSPSPSPPPSPPATSSGKLLVGNQSVTSNPDSNIPGQAQAYPYVASSSGTLSSLSVYVDTPSQASSAVVGLYTNSAGSPSTLLATCTVAAPKAGGWNSCVTSAAVTAGTTYWLAILGPTGTGTLAFRDTTVGSATKGSAQTNLSALPATWTSANVQWGNAPAAVYASS